MTKPAFPGVIAGVGLAKRMLNVAKYPEYIPHKSFVSLPKHSGVTESGETPLRKFQASTFAESIDHRNLKLDVAESTS